MNYVQQLIRRVSLPVIWFLFLACAFWQLLTYANTPGKPARSLAHWPTGTKLEREANQPTLLIFGHPQCPCSNASVGELERLMPHIIGKVKSYVVFVKPKNQTEGWAKEALWKKTNTIPAVNVILDEDGVEAKLFGAQTSGQTFLYDPNGNLIFRGGITAARGHMGDNAGREAILTYVKTGNVLVATTPVFGCSLNNPERAPSWGSR